MSEKNDTFQEDHRNGDDLVTLNKRLKKQNSQLKKQLMNASMINELTKVLHSCTDVNNIIQTALLAMQELLQFDRIILFKIVTDSFTLAPSHWVGFDDSQLESISIPMGFEGGEVTDAIFLNRHIIVEDPDKNNDIFCKTFGSTCYLSIPMTSKLNRTCKEIKGCTKKNCPAYDGFNPYCWSLTGAGQLLNTRTEDDRRRCCSRCEAFKTDSVFWMDRSKSDQSITSDDITQLTAIVNLTGILVENSRILKALDTANNNLQTTNNQLQKANSDLQIAQSKIQCDLDHARSIQQGLLPGDISGKGPFSAAAIYISADAVGGDYYDVFEISPDVYGLVVADVSGHGVASALIMSMAKVLLKTFSTDQPSPQKTLERINSTFISEIKTDNFVTIFYAVLDTKSQKITFTSAGHCPILFLDKENQTCQTVKADGLFMGVFPDMMLSEKNRSYKKGNNRILLYTDGIAEAQNRDGIMYGIERLSKISLDTLGHPPIEAVDAILEDQKRFCGTVKPEDDITLLVVDY